MLVLTFQVAEMAYAVAASAIVEVVPRVELRPLPHAPAHLAGLLLYRGSVASVIDLGLLMGTTPCRDRLDTRIILMAIDRQEPPGAGVVGLIAERVNGVHRLGEENRAIRGLDLPDAPYLGAAYRLGAAILQMIDPGRIALGSGHEARAVAL